MGCFWCNNFNTFLCKLSTFHRLSSLSQIPFSNTFLFQTIKQDNPSPSPYRRTSKSHFSKFKQKVAIFSLINATVFFSSYIFLLKGFSCCLYDYHPYCTKLLTNIWYCKSSINQIFLEECIIAWLSVSLSCFIKLRPYKSVIGMP